MKKLRLKKIHPSSRPPAGFVDVKYDTALGALVIVRADGTVEEIATSGEAPGDTAPTNESFASLIAGTGSAKYSVVAKAEGGETISFEVKSANASAYAPLVALSSRDISVTPGGKTGMTVTTNPVSQNVSYKGMKNTRPYYTYSGIMGCSINPTGGDQTVLYYAAGRWNLIHTHAALEILKASVEDSAMTPDLITGDWEIDTGTGVTSIVASNKTHMDQVEDAWNNNESVSALAELKISSTNVIETFAKAYLVAPVTVPPYLRVAGGYLYALDNGTWKQLALSALGGE